MRVPIVQDYIRIAIELDRSAFLRRVEVPVLVWQGPEAGAAFAFGQTRLRTDRHTPPPVGELLRRAHALPVLALRQRNALPVGQVRLGRTGDNDVVVQDDTISSHHAAFRRNDRTGSLSVDDLGSTNGSRVNGRVLVAGHSVVLFDADQLEMGDSVFLFFYPDGLYQSLRKLVG